MTYSIPAPALQVLRDLSLDTREPVPEGLLRIGHRSIMALDGVMVVKLLFPQQQKPKTEEEEDDYYFTLQVQDDRLSTIESFRLGRCLLDDDYFDLWGWTTDQPNAEFLSVCSKAETMLEDFKTKPLEENFTKIRVAFYYLSLLSKLAEAFSLPVSLKFTGQHKAIYWNIADRAEGLIVPMLERKL